MVIENHLFFLVRLFSLKASEFLNLKKKIIFVKILEAVFAKILRRMHMQKHNVLFNARKDLLLKSNPSAKFAFLSDRKYNISKILPKLIDL